MSDDKVIMISKEELDEIDRTARAYGFEIGHGHPITEQIDESSPENPFLDPNWRAKLKRPEVVGEPGEGIVHDNVFSRKEESVDEQLRGSRATRTNPSRRGT